jgi:hypothetical protein
MKKRGFIIAVVLFLLVVGLAIADNHEALLEGTEDAAPTGDGDVASVESNLEADSVGDGDECRVQTDCGEGLRCIENQCVVSGGDGCSVQSDCSEGQRCVEDQCQLTKINEINFALIEPKSKDCDDENCDLYVRYGYKEDMIGSNVKTGVECSLRVPNPNEIDGCRIFFVDKDTIDDDGGYADAETGTIIDNQLRDISHVNSGGARGSECGGGDGSGSLRKSDFTMSSDFEGHPASLICGSDNLWYQCDNNDDENGGIGSITWVNDVMYECKFNEFNYPIWEELDTDFDKDGFTTSQDCDDNPLDEPAFCDIETPRDCSTISADRRGQCSICVNPNAGEIAGDGIDNDCSDRNPDVDTSDDADLNRFACERGDLDGKLQTNIYDEKFDYVNTEQAGFCCGVRGVEDLGKIAFDVDENVEKICLNKEYAKSKDGIADCENEWCLVAATGNAAFKVMTVNTPTKTYDVVSNNNKWSKCEEGVGEIVFDGAYEFADNQRDANRFYCYKEGDKYSWAECSSAERGLKNEGTIKSRVAGDGLYGLYFTPGSNRGSEISISSDSGLLNDYYTDFFSEVSFDFREYQFMEFMVRFVKSDGSVILNEEFEDILNPPIILPANVEVSFLRRNDQNILQDVFSKEALGYVTNSPKLNNWMHVKLPIADLSNIDVVKFSTEFDDNEIEVRNVFLSNENSRICSGQDARDQNTWIENLDYDSVNLNAKDLCNELYESEPDAKDAWIGNSCCGNNLNEYNSEGFKLGDNFIGCWNSEPISSGERVMNVEFDVTSNDPTYEVEEVLEENPFTVTKVRKLDDDSITFRLSEDLVLEGYGSQTCGEVCDDDGLGGRMNCRQVCYDDIINREGSIGEVPRVEIKEIEEMPEKKVVKFVLITSEDELLSKMPVGFGGPGPSNVRVRSQEIESDVMNFEVLNQRVDGADSLDGTNNIDVESFIDAPEQSSIPVNPLLTVQYESIVDTLDLEADFSKVFFFNFRTGDVIDGSLDLIENRRDIGNIKLISKPKSNFVSAREVENQVDRRVSYACYENSCTYPVVGNAPYTITNPYPNLYELYFISDSNRDQEILIDGTRTFEEQGNVIAKKVSLPVVYIKKDEGEFDFDDVGSAVVDEDNDNGDVNNNVENRNEEDRQNQINDIEGRFYGCQAPSFIAANEGIVGFENLNHCSVKSNFYCAFNKEVVEGNDKYSVINTWNEDGISKVGYIDMNEENAQARVLDERIYAAVDLDTSTSGVYGRNILSNFVFRRASTTDVANWDIFQGNVKVLDEEEFIEETDEPQINQINLPQGFVMRSEKIAVQGGVNLHFSQDGNCEVRVGLVSLDGAIDFVQDIENIQTNEDTSNIVLEFESCVVRKPMLQLIDTSGESEFTIEDSPISEGNIRRSGAACCPQNHCWNGFTCVKPMDEATDFTENTGEGKDYRCVEGIWVNTPRKFDWNYEKSGFCRSKEECFVKSGESASYENEVEDFYLGNSPICVKDGEYILDNYCDGGDWTSRTQFAAKTLLESTDANDEFVLYCDGFENVLPDIGTYRNYIDGDIQVESGAPEVASGLDEVMADGQEEGADGVVEEEVVAGESEIGYNCFNLGREFLRDDENNCINNVCILKQDDDITIATSVNQDIDGPDSFLLTLGVSIDNIETVCPIEDNPENFVECDVDRGSLYFNNATGVVIYNRDDFSLEGGAVENFVDFIKGFLGIEDADDEEQLTFITNAQNMKKAYVSSDVRSMQSFVNGSEELVAEFLGFENYVCDFLKNKKVGPLFMVEDLEAASGFNKMTCGEDGELQVIKAKTRLGGTEELWPMVSGRLR